MRIESSVTAISWIPSEAISGMPKLPFELGVARYDDPPPDLLGPGDLDALYERGAFREANELRAWIEIEDGRIVGHGYSGRGLVASGSVPLDVHQSTPEIDERSVRFMQTVGGRVGFPAPRRVKGKPYFRVTAADTWTTLALTIHADGESTHELISASTFPRHWIYDRNGNLTHKSGVIDFAAWYHEDEDETTPWTGTVVTEAETSLERRLSRWLMRDGHAPERLTLGVGETLVEQGARGSDLYLLLDGVLSVEVDGEQVAEIGPGAVVGERAVLGGSTRTATLRAQTPSRIAVVDAELLDRKSLDALSASRDS